MGQVKVVDSTASPEEVMKGWRLAYDYVVLVWRDSNDALSITCVTKEELKGKRMADALRRDVLPPLHTFIAAKEEE